MERQWYNCNRSYQKNGKLIRYASERFQYNRYFAITAIETTPVAYNYLPVELKYNKRIIFTLLSCDARFFVQLPSDLKKNECIITFWIQKIVEYYELKEIKNGTAKDKIIQKLPFFLVDEYEEFIDFVLDKLQTKLEAEEERRKKYTLI